MQAAQILDELGQLERLPVEAIRAADADRASAAPMFVDTIERYLAQGGGNSTQNAIFFMFHLLGQWREKAAHRPLARLLRRPPDEVDAIFGDALAETTYRVMAAVFDGDPEPLYDVILDSQANEYVILDPQRTNTSAPVCARRSRWSRRAARCRARRPAASCAHAIPPSIRRAKVGCGTVGAIAFLGLAELKPLVEHAFARGFISPGWLRFEHFEEDLQRRIADPAGLPDRAQGDFSLFGDTIEELSHWFRSEEERVRNALPARTHRHCGGACRQKTRCGMWAAMIPVRAAAAGNSRNAASQPTPVQQPCLPADAAGAHSCTARKRSAFPITLTEESAIAAAAMTGESRTPSSG
jgi:Protein of unknown function (DUF1186)